MVADRDVRNALNQSYSGRGIARGVDIDLGQMRIQQISRYYCIL